VSVSPVPAITAAILSGVAAAYVPGYMVLRRGGVSDGVNNLPQT
jgi:hypothetical protein